MESPAAGAQPQSAQEVHPPSVDPAAHEVLQPIVFDMASLSSVSKDFSRSVLYSRQKRLAAVAQVCNTPRLATNRGSETVSLLMRRLHTNLRHAVQKRALAGSQCLHACSHSRQNLHDEGQDDQARHSTRDLLPACNVVGAVPMPCAYHLFCNCWCAVTSRVHAERTPSEDYDKAMRETHRCTASNWHASGN